MSKPDDLIGKTVGNYELVDCLGVGGMGAVFLAEHPTIRSQVAIKVLHEEHVADAVIVKRFLDEARAVNLVGHQGVVRIHDCGTQPDVGVYLVMEYLQGVTLLELFNRSGGQVSPDLVVRLMRQAAAALAATHRVGIIHRDLKPSNIFLIEDPEVIGGYRLKILDFGVAKLVEDRDSLAGDTKTGTVLGSPQFMSPEQCLDSKNVDGRTDIFSLGAIGYLLLTGRLPYPGESVGQVIMSHMRSTVVEPCMLRPEVPEELSRIILRALARDREDRLADMVTLEEALRGVLAATSAAAPAGALLAASPGPEAKSSPAAREAPKAAGRSRPRVAAPEGATEIHDGSLDDLLHGGAAAPAAAPEPGEPEDGRPQRRTAVLGAVEPDPQAPHSAPASRKPATGVPARDELDAILAPPAAARPDGQLHDLDTVIFPEGAPGRHDRPGSPDEDAEGTGASPEDGARAVATAEAVAAPPDPSAREGSGAGGKVAVVLALLALLAAAGYWLVGRGSDGGGQGASPVEPGSTAPQPPGPPEPPGPRPPEPAPGAAGQERPAQAAEDRRPAAGGAVAPGAAPGATPAVAADAAAAPAAQAPTARPAAPKKGKKRPAKKAKKKPAQKAPSSGHR